MRTGALKTLGELTRLEEQLRTDHHPEYLKIITQAPVWSATKQAIRTRQESNSEREPVSRMRRIGGG
jgi:hypothetical protein